MDILLEYSRVLAQVPAKYHDFIKALHQKKLLAHDQILDPQQASEPPYTSIRSSVPRQSSTTKRIIVWGQNAAVLVGVSGKGYSLAVLDPDRQKFEIFDTTNTVELKKKIKSIVGKIEGHTAIPSRKDWAQMPISMTSPDIDPDNIRAMRRAVQAREKILKPQKAKSSDDMPYLVQSVLRKIQFSSHGKSPEEIEAKLNSIRQLSTEQNRNIPFLLFELLRPMIQKYVNKKIGDLGQLLQLKVESASRHYPTESNQQTVDYLYQKYRFLRNFAFAIKEGELENLYTTGTLDPRAAIIHNTITNAIAMAAAQKYPDQTTISGHPTRNFTLRNFPGADGVNAGGEGYDKFLKELLSGDKSALGAVMNWLGLLL